MSDTDQPLFHLALPEDWAAAFAAGEYAMSTRGMTLAEVGFIHCSTRDQTEATANRFYADVDQLVDAPLILENTVGGAELFPHIYGPLPIAAVNTADFWTRPELQRWQLDD